MTVYQLIEKMTAGCAAGASFGDVKLWWSEKNATLYLSRRPPTQDAKEV